MNLQQQREAVRRRRLVSRGAQPHRQRHLDEIRLGRVASRMIVRPAAGPVADLQPGLDDPAATRLVKIAIIATMVGLLAQFHAPLLAVALAALPGIG